MKVKLTFTEEMLGTATNNPEIYEEFLGKNCADKEKVKEELATLHTDDLVEKSMTVLHRDDEGNPILFDYQVKGFFKEAFGAQVAVTPMTLGAAKMKVSKYTVKRVADNYLFVSPRQIKLELPEGGEVGTCTRPLRAETMRGERVALAHSETVPAGTSFIIDIDVVLGAPIKDELIGHLLDYGKHKGIGQWRNSGKGRFAWEVVS